MSEAALALRPEKPPVASTGGSVLRACSLEVSYKNGTSGNQALRGVDLAVQKGEFVSIVGPSGCGKSTLLHVMGGLLTPTSGRLFIDGVELTRLSDGERTEIRRTKIGVVFQRFNLFPTLTLEGNLRLAEKICLGRESASGEHRKRLLELLGLSGKEKQKPTELSGGEQQRVAIARALIHSPRILLADEPTGNLDSENSRKVLALFRRVHQKLGQTIVMITHDPEAAACGNRLVGMRDGRVIPAQ